MGTVNTDEGSIRLVMSDASETNKRVVGEWATELLDRSTDMRQQIIMPKSKDMLEEDDKLIIEVSLLAASNVDYTATETFTKMLVPVTIRNKRTGTVFEKALRHPDFASADVTVSSANVWTVIGTYTVSAQEQVKIGWNIAENSRIYMLLAETGSS